MSITAIVTRDKRYTVREDMGSATLTGIIQEDGDVILSIFAENRGHVEVEFCVPGTGGGRSPHVWQAAAQLVGALAVEVVQPALDDASAIIERQRRVAEEKHACQMDALITSYEKASPEYFVEGRSNLRHLSIENALHVIADMYNRVQTDGSLWREYAISPWLREYLIRRGMIAA